MHADLSLLCYPSAVGATDDLAWTANAVRAVEKMGFESITWWEDDCEVLVAWDDTDLYFAFRGSTTGFDWMTNAEVLVADAYESSLDEVWTYVSGVLKVLGRSRKIHWTGHSKNR